MRKYIVVHEGQVVQEIMAGHADHAYEQKTEEGELAILCGPPGIIAIPGQVGEDVRPEDTPQRSVDGI